MTVIDTVPPQAARRTGRRQPWVALGLALLCVTSYVVAQLLPYYANDLHRRPEGEPRYLLDMSALWPYDTALGWLVSLLAVFSFALAPVVGFGVASWSAYRLWDDRRAPRARMVWLAAMVLSVAAVAWIFTPLAGELRALLVD